MRPLILSLLFLLPLQGFSRDSTFIKVHFLYGSRPAKGYKSSEPKWFGGKPGGHVGIEIDSGLILNFIPQGEFHWIAQHKDRHSAFVLHDTTAFWEVLGGRSPEVKKASIVIPVSAAQKLLLDSLSEAYRRQTPYDYAFLGMRCGAAAYEVLSQAGIVDRHPTYKTAVRIFYPKLLRQQLLHMAASRHWLVLRQEGTERRVWERD